ncbi:MAG: serine protease, partial [Candidatus Dormibacteraceae bacterium]
VAMDADHMTGMRIGGTPIGPYLGVGTQYAESPIAGTSLAAPLFAGVQALAQQARGNQPIGFANPALYHRYNTPSFRDITTYKLPDGSYPAAVGSDPHLNHGVLGLYTLRGQTPATPLNTPTTTPGYDEVTGIGAPTSAYLSSWQ